MEGNRSGGSVVLRPSRDVLESLVRLQGNPEFTVILDWIAASRNENFLLAEVAQKDDVERRLGYGLALHDILHTATNARDSLSKTGR